VTRIFSAMQNTNRFGYACAEAVIFGTILVCVSFITKKLSDKAKQA
jgi:ABC-type sugar transport system permease subunit